MSEASRVAGLGSLSGSVQGFTDYLDGLGYAPASVVLRLNLLRHLSRWLAAEEVDPSGFDAVMVERFLVARKESHTDLSSLRALAPLLTYLRSAGVIPQLGPLSALGLGPVDALLARWSVFLAGERALKGSTIRYYTELVRPFLLSRVRGDLIDVSGLDARAVSEFVWNRLPGLSIGMAKLTVTALRSLLQFLFVAGLVSERLDGAVPSRAGYRDAGLPRGLRPEQLEALTSAIDLGSKTPKRDLAIVLLLARLGLRAGEVAALSLDDVDWRAGTLRVPGKGGQIDLLPLPVDVGEALAAHLQVARHPAMVGRMVFFGSAAPYWPLSVAGVKGVVQHAGVRSGLGPLGAHRLRHTVATVTINAGASLQEVAQLLRHRHLGSTTIYAKVDLTRLTELARPWPATGVALQGGLS